MSPRQLFVGGLAFVAANVGCAVIIATVVLSSNRGASTAVVAAWVAAAGIGAAAIAVGLWRRSLAIVAPVASVAVAIAIVEVQRNGWDDARIALTGGAIAAVGAAGTLLWRRDRWLGWGALASAVIGLAAAIVADGKLDALDYVYVGAVGLAIAVGALIAVTLLVPPPWVLAAGLVMVLSPISKDGTQLLSTGVTIFFAASLALGVALSGRWSSAWAGLPRSLRRAQIAMIALLLLSAAIGAGLGHSPRLILWDLEPFVEFAAFAWLGVAVLREERHTRLVVGALIAAGGLKAGYDLVVFWQHFTPQLRAAGLDGFLANRVLDPGPMLALPLACIWMLKAGRPSWRTWWPLASIALIVPLLVISFTRSYWLGFALAAVLVVAVERGAVLRRSAIAAAVAAAVVAVGALAAPHGPVQRAVDLVQKRIAFTTEQASSSATPLERRRQDEVRDAINASLDEHLLGSQAGSLVPIKFAQKTSETEAPAGFHNYFLQVLFKFGAVGLALFLWLIGTCIWAMWLARRAARGWPRTVALAALAVWLMEFIQLLLNPLTVSFHIPAIMGALCAAALAGRTARPAA